MSTAMIALDFQAAMHDLMPYYELSLAVTFKQ